MGERTLHTDTTHISLMYRALAGALHKVLASFKPIQNKADVFAKIGLLSKDNVEQVPFAYKLYKRTDAAGIALAAGFKQTFSRDVGIEFVGVWYPSILMPIILLRDSYFK